MIVSITVFFSHTQEALSQIIKKATGYEPVLKKQGDNYLHNKPVYLCEIEAEKKHDKKIMQSLKRLNVKVGEVIDSPPPITEDTSALKHKP